MRFVDTNVLLYAVSTTDAERDKRAIALQILSGDDLAFSVQVLQEFYVQATRSSRPDPLTHEQAAALIESWLRFKVMETSVALVEQALATRVRWQVSYWDAAVIEAARALRCRTLLSEDLQNGMDFAGVVVQNPFVIGGA